MKVIQNHSNVFQLFLEKNLGKAVLQYENEGHNTMNMYHTQVPTEYRGQGIARHLAKVSAIVKLTKFSMQF